MTPIIRINLVWVLALALAGCSSSNEPTPDGESVVGVSSDVGAVDVMADDSVVDEPADASTVDEPADVGVVDEPADSNAVDEAADVDVVDEPADVSVVSEPIEFEVVGQSLLVSLAGLQAQNLSLSVRELAGTILEEAEAMPLPDTTIENSDGSVTSIEVNAYSCNAGGQMIHESRRLREGLQTQNSLRLDYDVFTFEACSHSESGSTFTDGDYQFDGKLEMRAFNSTTPRSFRNSRTNIWTAFSMNTPDDHRYELSGSVSVSKDSSSSNGMSDSFFVDLPSYRKLIGDQTFESLEGVLLTYSRDLPNGSNNTRYQLVANGMVVSPATLGHVVTINTDPPLYGETSSTISEPFSGQIRMLSVDAGELILSGNPTSQVGRSSGLLVDLVALRPDGTSITGDAVPLINVQSGQLHNNCFFDDATDPDCSPVELP